MSYLIKLYLVVSLFQIIPSITSESTTSNTSLIENVSQECNHTVFNDVLECEEKSMAKWNSINLNMFTKRIECCNYWNIIDCKEYFVKLHCNKTDQENFKTHYKDVIREETRHNCYDYPYYGTQCTISEKDIKPGTPQEIKMRLITKIPEISKTCQGDIDKFRGPCELEVLETSGYTNKSIQDDHVHHKFQCCYKYQTLNCVRDKAKKSEQCSHQDVVGLIYKNDQLINNLVSLNCSDYPLGSEKCNYSYKQTLSVFALAIIFIQVLLTR